MKVFVSWSGDLSSRVAKDLCAWLALVFGERVTTFYSTEDIRKGTDWLRVLRSELNGCDCAIVCITRDNVNSPWLNFEAGAIGKHLDDAVICPLLIHNFPKDAMTGPLSHFQGTALSRDDVKKLTLDLNGRLPKARRENINTLSKRFDALWPKLAKALAQSWRKHTASYRYDLFVSFPIRGFENDAHFERERDLLVRGLELFRQQGSWSTYCTADQNRKPQLKTPLSADILSFANIRASRAYALIQPIEVSSFTLVECGVAIGGGQNVLVLSRDDNAIPEALRRLSLRHASFRSYKNANDLSQYLFDFMMMTISSETLMDHHT